MVLRTRKAIVCRRDNHPWLLTAFFTAVLGIAAPCLAQTETFQRAFAFGADSYSMGVPNAPGNQYTKIVQNGSGFSYTSAQGFGYTNVAAIDGSPNNRGKINCEIYDQMIGAKSGRIVFRVNVPNGDYRFVASGGDAGYDSHQTRILAKDGSLGDSAVLVSGITLNKLNYFSVGFNGKISPSCAAATFVAQPVSPTLRVTSGYIEIHQITSSTGGDLCLVELWRIDDNSNAAPVVNAGRDTTVMVGTTLQLQGSVTDDGRVNATPTLNWRIVSGTAPVSFSDSSNAITTVTFSTAGSYVLRLLAYDGELTSHDDVTVTVNEPSAWTSTDIGAVGLSGSATYSQSGGSWSVKGSGADIWGTADAFQFLYRQMIGDFEIVARTESLVNTNRWAKAGVMIRGSLSANSPHALMAVTPSNGLAFQRRLTSGGTSSNTAVSGGVPRWVRVKRTGTTLTGSVSSDGTMWTTVGSATVSLGQLVYAGCAVTSHDNTKLTTAVFTGVSVVTSGIAPPINHAPVMAYIESRTAAEAEEIVFVVSATDPDGDSVSISAPQLPAGASFSNKQFRWVPGYDQAGLYKVSFIGTDGSLSDTIEVSITVTNTNRLPVLSTIGGQSAAENSLLTIKLYATDPDSDSVRFTAHPVPVGATLTGSLFSWTPAYNQSGVYSVTFAAHDSSASDSELVTITVANVNRAPVVNAGADQSIAFGEPATMQGTVLDDGLPEGAVITTFWSQTGGPEPVTFTDSLSPRTSVTFSAPGIYALRLKASDGALTSHEDVIITVSGSVAHPRLFIAAGKIDSIRSAVAVPQTHHSEAFAAMKARVDQNDWRIYDDNAEDGNWNYPRSWLAREAALMYQITGSQWYADIAYDAIMSMYTDVDPDGRRPDSGYGLARAATGVGMAIAYDWCYNGWLASQRTTIHTKMTEALDAWLDFRHANIDNWHKSSNWTAVCKGGELILMLASCEETARESRYQTIKTHLNTHMLNAYGNGGLSQEGISYSSYAGRFLIPAVLACRSVGDTTLDALFDAKPFWRLAMTSTAFTPTLLKVQTGVDGSGGDIRGWPSLLFVNAPSDSTAYYRYWYDRTTGIYASPVPSQKYDGVEGGTIWSLICYPKNVASVKPDGAFSVHKDTVQGGYFLRNRYQNADDILVSVMSDIKHLDNSWDAPEATQINLIARGIKFFGGPFKTTTADVFSTLLVDNANHTSTKHTGTQLFWRGDSGGCYSMVGGGEKYAALGVDTVVRHTMVDFRNLPGEAVVSTLDKVRDLSTHTYGWQVNVGDDASDFGIVVSSGTESGCPYFLLSAPNGAYVKGWVLSPSGASVVAGDPLQVRTTAANADLWVSMVTGSGTAPTGVISGSGMGSSLQIGVMTIRYDQQADRIVAQSAANQAPSVDAGSDVSGTTGSVIMLDGIATDDGLPAGSLLSSAWTLMSGPAAATFGDTTQLSTSVSFSVAGTYVLRLRVTDGELESYDDVTAVIGEPDTVEQILLNDNFANMNNWSDLSRLISWGGHGSGISGFQTSTVQGRNAVYLTSDAMANSGYSTESSLKTFTALDYIFPRTVNHRGEVLTVRFTARWDALSAESGRLMLVLMDEYPAGGVSGSNYDVLSANHYGTPAYHFRLRPSTSTSELSLLEYGGGDGGVFEIYNNQWWLPGFISNASGSSSATPGVGAPYPSSNWIGTTRNFGNTEWANYTYKIMPDRQEIYRNDTLYGTMELPETNTAPQYEYFEQFKALRIYFRGINQCYLANVTVSVMPKSVIE